MENSNQTSPQVPSGLPTPHPMPPHIKAKHNSIPVLIMLGILFSLVLGALMMESIRNGEFALSSKVDNFAAVGRLAQSGSGELLPQPNIPSASVTGGDEACPERGGECIITTTTPPPLSPEVQARVDAMEAGVRATSVTEAPALLPPPVIPAGSQTIAQPTGADCTGNRCQFDNPLGRSGTLEVFLNKLLDVIILIGSIVVVLSIIMAGLKYVTAQGDEGQIASAHKQLTWTVIGAAILLGAKVIAMVVQNTVKALS